MRGAMTPQHEKNNVDECRILYDRDCLLCKKSVAVAKEAGIKGTYLPVAGENMVGVVVEDGGSTYIGYDAVVRMLSKSASRWWRLAGWVGSKWGIRTLGRKAYLVVAANRRRISARLERLDHKEDR
jgi:predicted DCC family thiol-disulfide oxidoreductase YuxK